MRPNHKSFSIEIFGGNFWVTEQWEEEGSPRTVMCYSGSLQSCYAFIKLAEEGYFWEYPTRPLLEKELTVKEIQ